MWVVFCFLPCIKAVTKFMVHKPIVNLAMSEFLCGYSNQDRLTQILDSFHSTESTELYGPFHTTVLMPWLFSCTLHFLMSLQATQTIKGRRDQNKYTFDFSLISRFDFQASDIVTYPAVGLCQRDLLSVPYSHSYNKLESPTVSSFKTPGQKHYL